MRAELPSWPDTCREVSARIDALIAQLGEVGHSALSRRQRRGRDLAITNLRNARRILNRAAPPTETSSIEAHLDRTADILEQGEYVDPNDIEWPDEQGR